MNIIETNIPDITEKNLDQSKIDFSDKITEAVLPLFDEALTNKRKALNAIKEQQIESRKKIHTNKVEIQKLMEVQKRKQKVKKLLSLMEKMLISGLLNEGQLKQETIITLKIVDKLPDDKLTQQIQRATNLISKRFG